MREKVLLLNLDPSPSKSHQDTPASHAIYLFFCFTSAWDSQIGPRPTLLGNDCF